MPLDINILTLDSQIREKLNYKDNHNIEKKIKKIEKILSTVTMSDENKNILKKELEQIKKTQDAKINDLNFYISETIVLISKYKELLNIPKKISFMGKKSIVNNEERDNIIKQYLKIASKYEDVDMQQFNLPIYLKCSNCNSDLEFDVLEDDTKTCNNCSSIESVITYTSSYNDSERINISTKYSYDRRSHFRECVAQYHGVQNVNIPDNVYISLIDRFNFHGLLVGDENTPKEERFKNIKKKTVLMFLKELGLSKQYENVNLIYKNITGKKLDDISHLTEKLTEDFDIISDIYDKKFGEINRKNFINTQYVLYQLLRRHNHKCDKEDFTSLKTVDRKCFHEDVIKALFEELNWNYTSIF